ncbi:MAG TPA: LAGLIDADG family homing endonuclease [Candidatus Nanoarchaeia archaeon]|nr:LAGLIDADG family homing endonuclease [Candidatus Nanoarchaeia archaeon]
MQQLNREICEFIGAFIGDGFLGKYDRSYVVGLAGDSRLDYEYLAEHMQKLLLRNFSGIRPHIYVRSDENSMALKVYSKNFFGYMCSLGFSPGRKSRTVTIPKEIMCRHEFMSATVRGIFDTDGCVYWGKRSSYAKPYPRITLQVASQPLIRQLQQFLERDFWLYVNLRNRDGKRNYLEIYGHEQYKRFLKEIGFSNIRHASVA